MNIKNLSYQPFPAGPKLGVISDPKDVFFEWQDDETKITYKVTLQTMIEITSQKLQPAIA